MSLPKSQASFSYSGGNPGNGYRKKSLKVKTSTGDAKHPYLKDSFWANPTNHFWENDEHTEKGKEYFRKSLVA